MSIRQWLAQLELERYADAFEANDIDLAVLPELVAQDLVELGVRSVGHRKKLLAAARSSAPTHSDGIAVRRVVTHPEPSEELVRVLRERGFQLDAPIGAGGMGTVYRARQIGVERDVAIKLLRPSELEAEERFAREARAVAALSHPHSVRLFDFVQHEEGSALVMELVEGRSLADLLRREQRLPFDRLARIVIQVLDALTEAHEKGLVHRDLKPSNILLMSVPGYPDFARVLDFGLVRFVSTEERRLTRTGAVAGTPRYLSPEQIRNENVTLQTDLYAVGLMLFEGLTSRTPFAADLDAALILQHLSQPAPPLPNDVERPRAFDDLLSRLLEKSPAMRPPSAHAVRRELAAMIDHAARRPESASGTTMAAVPERRRVVVVAIAFDASDPDASDEEEHTRVALCRAALGEMRHRYEAHLASFTATSERWVFGAPIAHADERGRALAAALDARDALVGVSGTAVRVGVAEGRAVAGGAGRRYLVVGPALEHASRLCALAPLGEVSVERALLEPDLASTARDPSSDERSVTLRRARTTSRVTRPAELPFVGRAAELATLDAELAACRRLGTAHIAVIAGEAGIGKTRLLDELQRRLIAVGTRVARAAVRDLDLGEDLVRQLVRTLLDVPDGIEDPAAHLEARLSDSTLEPSQWAFLFHFLGIPFSRPMQRVYDAMSPEARRASYRDMLDGLLASETARGPLVLMIEDMHQASAASIEAVEQLSGMCRSRPVLLVITTRVEGEARWQAWLSGQTVVRLELEPLAAGDATMLATALGGDAERRARVIERAGGHPLFLTEMLRGAVGEEEQGELPETIHELVHSRLDRLPEGDRAAVQVAAVLGLTASLQVLRDLLEDPRYDASRPIAFRLLRPTGDGWAFTHALVRDAVYGALVEERRRALHLRCAERLADAPGLAAAHLERGGAAVEASEAYLRAAGEALAHDRYEEALAHASRARRLAEPASSTSRGALLLRARVELRKGDASAAEASFAAYALEAADDPERYDAAVGRAEALFVANRFDDARAALRWADELAAQSGLRDARASYVRGRMAFATGDLEACREAHSSALALARENGDGEFLVRASSGLADALYGVGRLVSALPAYERCVREAEREELLGVVAVNEPMLAIVSVFLNELDVARRLADRALVTTAELSHKRGRTLAHGAASLAAYHAGEWAKSYAEAEAALALGRDTGTLVFEVNALYYMARAALGDGDRALATRHVSEALSRARGGAMRFLGGALLALAARLEPDRTARRSQLDEGAALLEGPALSFHRFWFHENAIEACLDDGDRDAVHRHADALERAFAAEPIPWVTLVIDRARALMEGDPARLNDVLTRMTEAGLVLGRDRVADALVADALEP
ncbi:MAG: protein kinase [Sandaracinaceae bacterium]